MKPFISKNFKQKAKDFVRSTDFSKALLIGIALTTPIVLGVFFDLVQYGIVITMGAMLASPSDTSGSLSHKLTGVFLSMVIAVLMSIIGGSLSYFSELKVLAIGILTFFIAYLSVYGFRASLVSFSGLFALVISFSPVAGDLVILERAVLIATGGVWYMFLVYGWHLLFPKMPTEFYLSKTFDLTSEYLKIRGQLASKANNRDELFKKLLIVQSELTDTHETLREILISTRKGSGQSVYEGKRLLIFALLIDMLELAMANPVNYSKTDTFFEKNPKYLTDFQQLLFEMSRRLKEISNHLSAPKRLSKHSRIIEFLKEVQEDVDTYGRENEIDKESATMLRNLYKYQSEQASKIEKIEWLILGPKISEVPFIKTSEAQKFLTKESYNHRVLVENLNFNSPIFRHSLRLSVVTIIGYLIGDFFEVQNSYWILLTIIVIMRPGYGLTKQRSQERTIGTLLGGAIAVVAVLLIQNVWIYAVLAIFSLMTSFTMIQKNFKAAAVFVTLSVVFSYALFTSDIFSVIQYRVVDTLIGTSLAVAGNILLWPAWEIQGIQKTLSETIAANKQYLKAIVAFYQKKGEPTSELKVSRKKAFLELSNLSSAFQRMTQEPKSQHKIMEQVYEIVVLNHTFLSSLASLSTYIITHPTTKASENFKKVSDSIISNLQVAEDLLNGKIESSELLTNKVYTQAVFDATYGIHYESIAKANTDEIEERQLIREQLKWLLSLSEKIPKVLIKLPRI